MSRARLLLLSLLLASTPALAADPESDRDAADLARAKQLREEASAAYAQIDKERRAGEAECARKILVNRCLDKLRDELNLRERAAKAQQVEAGKLERGVRARAVAQRDAEREAGRPERAQKQAEQGEQYKTDQTQKRDDLAKRQAEHNKAIAEGPERAKQFEAERAAKESSLAKKREADAKAAAARAKQAREDAARYEARRKEVEAKKASKAQSGASSPALPPLIEQGADAPGGVGVPPPPPPAN